MYYTVKATEGAHLFPEEHNFTITISRHIRIDTAVKRCMIEEQKQRVIDRRAGGGQSRNFAVVSPYEESDHDKEYFPCLLF